MTALTELEQYDAEVFRIETDTAWIGGEEGAANNQGKALANRTQWLKAQVLAAIASLGDHEAAADPHPQYATDVSVAAQLNSLLDGTPGALDTLNELAAALGDDPNFATTIVAALALKAPLASPTFTGTPAAPTPAQFDNDTSLATTAFIKNAGMQHRDPVTYPANQALTAAVAIGNLVVASGNTGAITFTLPALSACPAGGAICFLNSSAYNVTIARAGADGINPGDNTGHTSIILQPGDTFNISVGAAWEAFGGSACLPYVASFGYSLASNGYQILPSGLLICKGQFSASATPGGAIPVTFAHAFSSPPQVFLNPVYASPTGIYAWHDTPATGGFNGRCNIASATITYLAIGAL